MAPTIVGPLVVVTTMVGNHRADMWFINCGPTKVGKQMMMIDDDDGDDEHDNQ